jgi:midasin
VTRSLYEGFSLSFLTELDKSSHGVLEGLLQKYIISGKEVKGLLKQNIPEPTTGAAWHKIQGFWIPQVRVVNRISTSYNKYLRLRFGIVNAINTYLRF